MSLGLIEVGNLLLEVSRVVGKLGLETLQAQLLSLCFLVAEGQGLLVLKGLCF